MLEGKKLSIYLELFFLGTALVQCMGLDNLAGIVVHTALHRLVYVS